MNFTPDMLELVLSGKKTQTRRPVKETEYGNCWRLDGEEDWEINEVLADMSDSTSRAKWVVGKDYAVCPGRGKKAVARMTITRIRKERAIDISEDDARAEGFDSREAFWDKLRSLYGPNTDLTAPYWALTFELVKP